MHYKVNVKKIIKIQALYRGIKSRRMYEMVILTAKVGAFEICSNKLKHF